MKATAIYFTNSSKKSKRTGKIPIYLRVCFKGSKSECRLNAEISEKEVSKWDPMTMRIMERNSPINHYLNRLDQKFGDFIILHSNDISTYTALAIKNYVMGINATDKMTAMKFVDDYFNNAVLNNVDRTQGTIKNYRRSINHFRNFLKSCQKQDLLLENLNFEIAADFKNYLVNSNTVLNRVGMTEVSAAGVIKKFRTIFTDAADKDLLKRNPFKLVKIKTKSPRRERLSIEQIEKIYFLDTTNWQYLPIYRDIFLFSVYTGLAYHDAMSLTADNIESRKDGSFKLTVRRGKQMLLQNAFYPIRQ
ncbi:MAG: site-specific integrase [Chitinophagaceae bacterium]|nr:site-specific integrase [Chitinophagaceae bacterium]